MRASIVIVAALATGCASHSAIAPLGNSQFLISKQAATGFTGLGNMKAELMQQAHEHCASLGKEYEIISANESRPPYVLGNYPRSEITFRCR